MRLIVASMAVAIGACGVESEPQEVTPATPAVATELAKPTAASQPPMMPVPDDPDALSRLKAMGYTVHEEQGHLHAPGVASCPATGEGRAM